MIMIQQHCECNRFNVFTINSFAFGLSSWTTFYVLNGGFSQALKLSISRQNDNDKHSVYSSRSEKKIKGCVDPGVEAKSKNSHIEANINLLFSSKLRMVPISVSNTYSKEFDCVSIE